MKASRLLLGTALLLASADRLPAPIAEESPTPAATSTASVAATHVEAAFCAWMRNEQFKTLFQQNNDDELFPFLIEGRLHEGRSEFRAVFVKKPEEFSLYCFWGLPPWMYEQRNSRLKAQGYDILSQNTFRDVAGEKVYQTVWVRKEQLPAAKEYLKRIVP